MKVLTYNVHGWRTADDAPNTHLVADVITSTGADLVALNEVFHRGGTDSPLVELAASLGMGYAFGPTQQAADAAPHPPYGNALLSRHPILAYAGHHLAPLVSYGKRGMLEARVLLPGGQAFTVYVTHLDHRKEQVRLEQWAAAHTWLLRDRARPHLLLGDFNALAASDYTGEGALERLAAYQQERGWPTPAFDVVAAIVKAGYVDAYGRAGRGPGATFPAEEPERRIDYIFVAPACAGLLLSCAPLDTPATRAASDHLPVLAELRV